MPKLYFLTGGTTFILRANAPMNNLHLATQFFLQVAVILLVCRLAGAIAKRFGQPQVVADVLLGPRRNPRCNQRANFTRSASSQKRLSERVRTETQR